MSDLKLSVLINAIDEFSAPAKKVAQVSERMAGKLHDGQKRLQDLGKQKQAIDKLKQLESRLGKTAAGMDQARMKTAGLGRSLAETAKPTKQLQQQFDSARKKSDHLKQQHQKQREELRQLRQQLRGAGVDTRRLGDAQQRVTQDIGKTTKAMEKMAMVEAKVAQAKAKYEGRLQRAANVALVAGGLNRVGQGALGMVSAPVQQMRTVEKSKGELASLGVQDIDAVVQRGQQMSNQLAGVNTAAFVSAAYDIKSGISTLSDKGVADMTALAAMTAKATKSDVGQMTSLFATGYGSFKNSLFEDATDEEFGAAFSSMLSKSVQQFKTDGGKMQQAIQSMGSGLAESGISLSDQFTALGMLQQKMEAGAAGTTLSAIERTAAQAQQRFEAMGMSINTLDENGNLRSLPELLKEMQAAFGDEYTTEIGANIQKAFGSDEAVKFFKAMWGQQDVFRENSKALKAAREEGEAFTRSMAKAMDNNMDARLQLMQQRFDVIKQKLGYALVPVLEKVIPVIEKVTGWLDRFISNNTGLSSTLIAIVGGIGVVAVAAAPVITALASLGAAIAYLGYISKRSKANMMMGGMDGLGGGGGKAAKAAKAGKGGLLRRAGKAMGGKLGLLGAGIGVLSVGSTLMDSNLSAGEKAADVSNTAGSIGGALGGAKLGAALGTVLAPGIGTAVGGVLGSIIGGVGGSWLGDKVGSLFTGDDDKPEKAVASNLPKTGAAAAVTAALVATPAVAAPAPAVTQQQTTTVERIQIYQRPDEDAEALTERVMEAIDNRNAYQEQGAQHDE